MPFIEQSKRWGTENGGHGTGCLQGAAHRWGWQTTMSLLVPALTVGFSSMHAGWYPALPAQASNLRVKKGEDTYRAPEGKKST
eukprot:scaffold301373_cov18-Tisochrysis_lutea.AAC.1